ncbi:MAG: recombinase family protein [Candidatus Rokubacteria bacterium]|nr:recombinase family protein [Candidatus Rokubacteria bacterium]
MKGQIEASQLTRRAFVYVRQSSMAQVLHHQESTMMQYDLRQRALALGWAPEAIEVIDEDQGRSATTTDGRSGFGYVARAVAHGEAGGVFAFDVSRMARASEDFRRLLGLCGVAGVAVIDEQRIYDPSDHDDKLLLELKGAMSEAEIHWLRLRLEGARQHKARRGALKLPAPTGYLWGERGFELDPDEAVQRAVRVVFQRYDVEPSGWAVVRWARETGFTCPTRRTSADGDSGVKWKPLGVSRLHEMLKNPVYAGVYAYGRRREKKVLVDGQIRRVRPDTRDPDRWLVKIEGAHPGYITWERYVQNQEKLRQNLTRRGNLSRGAPREGPALLSGLLVCGRCGQRMGPGYARGARARFWTYICHGDRDKGQKGCWTVAGARIDEAVEQLFLDTMVPSELELALAVDHEVAGHAEELAQQWRARREQAAYEARRAEKRYKAVDPDNRVVARTLEREWESTLRELEEVERQYAEARRTRRVELSAEDRARVRELARDLPAVWRSPVTPPADRKAMMRLVIEAISLSPIEVPRRATRVKVAWQSGTVTEIDVPRPHRRDLFRTPPAPLERLRGLAAAGRHDEEIAEILNADGMRTGRGLAWNTWAVRWTRKKERICRVAPDRPRRDLLPDHFPDGRYSVAGAAKRFGVTLDVIRVWVRRGLMQGERNDFQAHRRVWWLEIPEDTAARLEHLAAPLRRP